MKRILIPCLLVVLAACGDDDDDLRPSKHRDSGSDEGPASGVCKLSECPAPEMGSACCTPLAQCGYDPSGLGLNCIANPGQPAPDRECRLADCATPAIGSACCTPLAECGFDPFASGLVCFGYPLPAQPLPDAGVPACEVSSCDQPIVGLPCCMANGECGWDPLSVGLCFAIPVFPDAGPPPPPPSTTPPDDPSVDGQCPSYLGAFGPVWGCCSDFGVCGTFEAETCLLPVGAPLPIDPDADAGAPLPPPFLRCRPPGD